MLHRGILYRVFYKVFYRVFQMVFYKVYKGFIGGLPYSVRHLIGYSI